MGTELFDGMHTFFPLGMLGNRLSVHHEKLTSLLHRCLQNLVSLQGRSPQSRRKGVGGYFSSCLGGAALGAGPAQLSLRGLIFDCQAESISTLRSANKRRSRTKKKSG